LVGNDLKYFQLCMNAGWVKAPFLEVGSAVVDDHAASNLCQLVAASGLSPCLGTDLHSGKGVDFVSDFGRQHSDFVQNWVHGFFNTVAVFNTLEHTFDPITMLKNVLSCVAPGGTIIVVAPCAWQLHDFPKDYVRLLPHWFEEFAQLHGLAIVRDRFCFISEFGVVPIDSLKQGSQYVLPNYLDSASRDYRYWSSRVVHRFFNTYGRSHRLPHSTIGCIFRVAPL
jgi:hypothetical protein